MKKKSGGNMSKSLKNDSRGCLDDKNKQLENCNINDIKSEVSALKEEIKNLSGQVGKCNEYIGKLITEQTKTNVSLELLWKVKNKALHFPINSIERLYEIDSNMAENGDTYKSTINSILRENGLNNGLPKLITTKVLTLFNYLGIKGKKSFKNLENFNSILYDCLQKDGYNQSQYSKEIKSAIKKAKLRFHKHQFDERQKSKK
ncbi:uncharacterized protein [Eurosta solidaginis]|uniref:uncharacterized protein n=1 Tax=Eurosta solidaginis TaxID=178769 RepID=UPI0035316CAF